MPDARIPTRTVVEKISEIMTRPPLVPCRLEAAACSSSWTAASLRFCLRRLQISLLTTKITTNPLSTVTNAEGTCTALCMLLAPTSRPPNRTEAGIDHSGCSWPNRATTMPLNPAPPVNPDAEPSVIMR